ncbi:NAD(P)H-hydrate dehydratase [Cellulomonas sp. zg-ZUI222]|uniref:ADP-dependent (S)-NAD(P)H-hydrate dehydratase n=1 Tax=Cellulomonas wangleii TaxID=2816956 RepID=A0ABX8D7X1_9CELL|nr:MULTISPECIES: NAD(P)H-hydrate dehydratase [Cellulomonas]MBO0900909.1 NAD(P)H-hydrate dehydratase [Cellulomonas sp. zg-ZUI22]MBO0921564.1 NAD(P)H-hydrate dehydratase [Cellulomonas wangleii]MBO0925060.1 NAD(P)H-hydrate dehydratase [Cellulomonas wangleii]QVI63524.1 NAD(P)H-hydrate dehydratase [Cellulomonas wangleii]
MDDLVLTPALLREHPLPEPTGGKDARGGVLVLGGARATPGAVLLAGVAALRVGAGRLSLGVAASVAGPLAVAVPEAGVVGLPEGRTGSVTGPGDELDGELQRADVVVVGPGLDEPDGTLALLRAVVAAAPATTSLVLDAFALGVLRDARDLHGALRGRTVLTPNTTEAGRLLGQDADTTDEGRDDADVPVAARLADAYDVVVACAGVVAEPRGRRWRSSTGYSGLGTSGSGDVLAGAVGGLLARGAPPAQAACFGVAAHGVAGDRLAASVGPHGYLASELLAELPRVLVELRSR